MIIVLAGAVLAGMALLGGVNLVFGAGAIGFFGLIAIAGIVTLGPRLIFPVLFVAVIWATIWACKKL